MAPVVGSAPVWTASEAIEALRQRPLSFGGSYNSLTELNNSCRDALQAYQSVLVYASEQHSREQDLLHSIRFLLDDQLVRFDIWMTEADVRDGTLEVKDAASAKNQATGEELPRCFELVEETLLSICMLLDSISDRIVNIIEEIENTDAASTYVFSYPYTCYSDVIL